MASKKKKKRIAKTGLPPGTLIYTGDREPSASISRTVSYGPEHFGTFEEYRPDLTSAEHMVWVDIRSISDVDFVRRVGEQFGLHALALEDVLNTNQRAKIDEYDNGIFLVLPNIHFDENWHELKLEQISMYIQSNVLITFQEDPDDTLMAVVQRLRDNTGRIRRKGTDYLAYAVIDMICDNYLVALDEIENSIFEQEQSIYKDGTHQHFKSRIFSLKYALNQFKHKVLPLRDGLTRLQRTDCPILNEGDLVFLRDVSDHVSQVIDQIESLREQITNIEALYQSEMSIRMNNVMKLLAVISTIFIPLSFIAGVYGMNFKNMPELEWRYGYFIVLGLMMTAMVAMLGWFRYKKWI